MQIKGLIFVTVCGVERESLKQALEQFREANIVFRKVFARHASCAFWRARHQYVAMNQRWIVRQGNYQAVSISDAKHNVFAKWLGCRWWRRKPATMLNSRPDTERRRSAP